ncbi:MAG TPA: PAS domain S-box protein [Phenylobacterium sp.]
MSRGAQKADESDASADFREMADHAPVMIWVTDASGKCTYLNKRWYDFTGQRAGDAAGFGWLEATHPADRSDAERIFLEANAAQQPFRLEYRLRRADGVYRWAIDAASPRVGSRGEYLGYVGTVIDIEDRRRTEQALAQSEERLRLATENSEVGFWDVDVVHNELIWPPRVKAMFGISPDAAVSMHDFYEGLHPSDRERTSAAFAAAADPERRELYDVEYRTVGKEDGRTRWVAARGRGIFDEQGRCVRLIGTAIEITSRKQTEAALRRTEARYQTLFNAINAGFCVVEVDLEGADGRIDYRVVEANPAFYEQTGFPKGVFGRWLREAAPTLEDHWYETYGRVARTGEPARFEQGSDLLGRWFDVHTFPVEEAGQHRVAILFNDISARRNAETQLRELNDTLEQRITAALAERELLSTIVEITEDPVQVLDLDYRWLALNSSCVRDYDQLFGVRPRVGDSLIDLLADRPDQLAEATTVWRRALGGEAFTHIAEFGDPQLERRFYEMKFEILRDSEGRQTGAFLTGRDVTQRIQDQERLRVAEDQLQQSRKMEAMGQLTGGVAHDFNNLLTPIIGTLDRLESRGVGDEREQRLISGALQSADRAKTLVQRLLAFARRQPLQAVAVDIGKLVIGMADLVGSTTGPQIKVVVEAADDLPPAQADPHQVEMALLNLAVNARDAMPEGGVLRISACAQTVPAGHGSGLPAHDYIRISVADTGIGMDQTTLTRAVSTKGIGKGTGLGLSMAHGLASQLGGALTINSQPGLGTNVELWLPVSSASPKETEARSELPQQRGRGRVLLVDDEEIVRLSTGDMLMDLGFEVVEAASAEEALGIWRAGADFDVLVTDHLMPGKNGTELAREIRGSRPELPVLVVSGYAEAEGLAPDLPRLTKPFRKSELGRRLGEITAGDTGGEPR